MNVKKVSVGIVSLMMLASSFAFLTMGAQHDSDVSSNLPVRTMAGHSHRTVLVESFTATHCEFCPPQTHTLERMSDELSKNDFVMIESHPDGAANVEPFGCPGEWNMVYNYLNYGAGSYSIPTVVFDGGGPYSDARCRPGPLSNTKYYPYTTDKSIFYTEHSDLTSFSMTMDGDINATAGKLHITLDFTDVPSQNNLFLKVRILENNMYFWGIINNEQLGYHHREFSHVVRDALTPIAIPNGMGPGSHLEYNISFTPNPAWLPNTDIRRLAAAAYVQTTNVYTYPSGSYTEQNFPVLQACYYEFVHPTILLVNDDHTDAIDNGICHLSEELRKVQKPIERWDTNETTDSSTLNARTMPTTAEMQKFGTVIWDCGKDTSTLSAIDRTNIASYLASGGCVFLTGSYIAEDANTNGWNSWLQTNFQATYVSSNTSATAINGATGDVIGDGIQWQKIQPTSPDEINPVGGGVVSLKYNVTNKNAAIRGTHTGGGRTVFFGCNYYLGQDVIDNNTQEETVLLRILNWQDQALAPKVDVLYPDGGEALTPGSQVTIQWDATDIEVLKNGVNVSYCTDYPTATWASISSNTANDGIFKWTVPAASSQTCRVRVVARDGQGNSGSGISGMDFTIGTIVPRWANMTVVSGWNMISVPIIAANTALPYSLTDRANGGGGLVQWDRVSYYNPIGGNDKWKQFNKNWNAAMNDLKNVNNTMAIWINVTTLGDGQICVGGTNYSQPTSTVRLIKAGWNLVGFPSHDTTYTVGQLKTDCNVIDIVEGFSQSQTYKTIVLASGQAMATGKGYWVHATADGTWTKTW